MKQVDTILHCRWVIPIVPHDIVHENYSIVIDKGKILALLPQNEVSNQYEGIYICHLTEHVVLPGFINAHTHSPMVLFRGLADDLPLMDWLHNHIWPAEAKWLNDEFITEGTELAIAEMIKGGTTCFNEHFFFPEAIANVVLKSKLRACIGPTIIDFPNNWSKNEKDAFAKFEEFYFHYNQKPLLTVSLAPHAPYSITDQILEKINYFAHEHNLTIHMHVQETAQEVAESLQKISKRPLQRLHDLGLLSKRFQCVHMTQVTEQDLELLNITGSHVTHCPESNLKLASGLCPVESLLQNNINVALGTDGAASNNDLDMMAEMRTAALIGKVVAQAATAVAASEALRMATINGAKALGIDHKVGSLTPGKEADLIAIDLNYLNTQPIYNPISQIVYSSTKTQVSDVWVAGIQVMKNKELTTLEEEAILFNAKKWQGRISNG